MRRLAVMIGCVAGVLAVSPFAFAHGDLEATSPQGGSTLRKAPEEVTITLTEAPSKGAEARAVDGCKKKVPAAVSVEGSDIVLALDGGEPGRWKVTYRAVSSIDGHQTRGTLTFRVAGKKDCSDEPEDDVDAPGNPGIVDNPNPPGEGGNTWLMWVGGGTILVVAAALFIRRSSQ